MPPMLLVLRSPLREGLLERAESEEEVLRLLGDRRRAVNLALRILQLERIEEPPAVLALVAAGAREPAVGAGPFHVPVRQEPLVRRAERGRHRRLVDVAFRFEREKDLLHPLFVMRIGGVPVEVILHAELRDFLPVSLVVPLRVRATWEAHQKRTHRLRSTTYDAQPV